MLHLLIRSRGRPGWSPKPPPVLVPSWRTDVQGSLAGVEAKRQFFTQEVGCAALWAARQQQPDSSETLDAYRERVQLKRGPIAQLILASLSRWSAACPADGRLSAHRPTIGQFGCNSCWSSFIRTLQHTVPRSSPPGSLLLPTHSHTLAATTTHLPQATCSLLPPCGCRSPRCCGTAGWRDQ